MWLEGVLIIAAIVAILVIYHRKKSKEFWDRVDGPGPVTNVRVEMSDD